MGRLVLRRAVAWAILMVLVYVRPAASQVTAAKVSASPAALEGRRVLLIVVPERAVHTAYFVAGTAHWSGTALEVRPTPDGLPVVAHGTLEALRPFSPSQLPRLIVREHATRVARLARDATACVAVFSPEPPSVGVPLTNPFFGLARGRGGALLLMQGDPDNP